MLLRQDMARKRGFSPKDPKIQISHRKGNEKCTLLVDLVLCTVLHVLDMQGGRIHGGQSRVQLLSNTKLCLLHAVNTRPVSETL